MRYRRTFVSIGCVCAITIGSLWYYHDNPLQSLSAHVVANSPSTVTNTANLRNATQNASTNQINLTVKTVSLKGTVPVVAIGGSTASGWDDTKSEGGYLVRTFRDLSQPGARNTYPFTNESVEGRGPIQYVTKLPDILQKDKPKLVVISFGMLGDLDKKTPEKQVNEALVQEVKDALASNAVVAFVTPPVTGASYSEFKSTEGPVLQSEMQAIEQIHSPNVHVVDLFTQMKAYLASHHQNWKTYAADGWHPNAAGHQLAASLLEQDLKSSSWF